MTLSSCCLFFMWKVKASLAYLTWLGSHRHKHWPDERVGSRWTRFFGLNPPMWSRLVGSKSRQGQSSHWKRGNLTLLTLLKKACISGWAEFTGRQELWDWKPLLMWPPLPVTIPAAPIAPTLPCHLVHALNCSLAYPLCYFIQKYP